MRNCSFRIALFLSFLLAACSSGAPNALSVSSDSGIEGTVVIGPVCPAERVDEPCPDKPFEAEIVVTLNAGGRKVTTFRSDREGKFKVKLEPETYKLIPTPPNPGAPPYAEPQVVKVESGKYARVTVKYDSGIR
jgi:hypothetical protein